MCYEKIVYMMKKTFFFWTYDFILKIFKSVHAYKKRELWKDEKEEKWEKWYDRESHIGDT